MNEITFKAITAESQEKDLAEAIYNEAFPERERMVAFDGMLKLEQMLEISNINLAYDGEQPVGFMNFFAFDDFIYLWFFAVNSQLRGGGYGSRILKAFMERFSDKAIIGCIETPIPGTSNYDQRVKRKVFYERLGINMTSYSFGEGEEDMLTLISSSQDEEATAGYIRTFFSFFVELGKSTGTAAGPMTKKFYRTVDGKLVEKSPAEWLS